MVGISHKSFCTLTDLLQWHNKHIFPFSSTFYNYRWKNLFDPILDSFATVWFYLQLFPTVSLWWGVTCNPASHLRQGTRRGQGRCPAAVPTQQSWLWFSQQLKHGPKSTGRKLTCEQSRGDAYLSIIKDRVSGFLFISYLIWSAK